MAFIDKKYFYGFERILDFWNEEEIKNLEDDEYRFLKCWEEGEINDYVSPNGR